MGKRVIFDALNLLVSIRFLDWLPWLAFSTEKAFIECVLENSAQYIEEQSRSLTLKKGITVSFFSYLTFFIFYLFFPFEKFYPVLVTIVIYLAIHGVLFSLLNRGKFTLTRLLYISLSTLFLANLAFFIVGAETGVHYFLLVFAVLAFTMSNPKRLWISFLYFAVNVALFVAAEFRFIAPTPLIDYPAQLAHYIRLESVILTFGVIFYVSYLFYRINQEKENQIKDKNFKLVHINNQLKETQKELVLQNEEIRALNQRLSANMELISAQKAELEIANENKHKFFSVIGHDLKNPLSVVIGLSEVLQMNLEDFSPEEIQKFAHDIADSANQIDVLLINLLNWSRSQTGNLETVKTEFSLAESTFTNYKLFRQNLKAKNISFSDESVHSPVVFADQNMLDTVLRNLLSNAIKFTETGGSIRLSDEISPDEYILHITDSGIGMSPEAIESIQNEGTAKSLHGTNNERGIGLGLLICRDFLELNGFKLQLKSELGKGSTVSIHMPIDTIKELKAAERSR